MNNWIQKSDDRWECALWDIYKEHGAWRACGALDDRPRDELFATAQEAKDWCDRQKG